MARIARVVAPGMPHLVTQRGNRNQDAFFQDDDYRAYLELMAQQCKAEKVTILAYSLLPNEVLLLAIPATAEGLALAFGEAQRRYTSAINQRENWRGFLWQGRFASFALAPPHLAAALQYVLRAPVRAGLVKRPQDWPWSSAATLLKDREDPLARPTVLVKHLPNLSSLLRHDPSEDYMDLLRRHGRTGRPLATDAVIRKLELKLGRRIFPRKRGRKPKSEA